MIGYAKYFENYHKTMSFKVIEKKTVKKVYQNMEKKLAV